MASVPLVVVKMTVRPATRSAAYSSGELPRSNPSIVRPPRSPARITSAAGYRAAAATAASRSATGTMRAQPAAQAATSVVVARNTSTATAARSPRSRPGNSAGVNATCTRMESAGLPLAVAERPDLEPERVQVDESLGIPLTVHLVGLEGHKVRAVERAWRLAARHRHRPLVELQAHGAGDVALHLVDQRLQRHALRREPEAVVDHLRVTGHERVAQVQHLPVERQRLDCPVRGVEDRSARCLVYPPGLHPDIAVLHEVYA